MYLQLTGATHLLGEEEDSNIIYDDMDTFATVTLGIYKSMLWYYRGQHKEAASVLNHLINNNSFKDYFHISTEIKLTLAWYYLALKEFDLADNLIKNIQRKIKSEKLEQYSNILDLIKVFASDIRTGGQKPDAKQKDNYLLFLVRNKNERKIVPHLIEELSKRYS